MREPVRRLIVLVSLIVSAIALAAQQVQPGSAATDAEFVYIVTGAKATGLYHRKNCPWLRDAAMQVFSTAEAKQRYFQPHCLCIAGKESSPPCDASAPSNIPAPAAATSAASPPVSSVTTSGTKSAPAPTASSVRQQCAATTKTGTRCSRMAEPGSAYCWQHKK